MVLFSRLLDAMSEVPDPRRAEGKRYPLAPSLNTLRTVLQRIGNDGRAFERIILAHGILR
jgi:hypothetical protein